MKIVKRIGIALGVLIVLLIAAAIVVPMFMSFNHFKPQIAEIVKKQTGRDIEIEGDIRLRLIPRFSFNIEDVTLSNAEGFAPDYMARIGELSVGVKVFPLLRKEIEITRVIVTDTELYYAVNKAGVSNIDDIIALQQKEPVQEQEVALETDSGSRLNIAGATIEDFKITNTKLSYADARANVEYILYDINAEAADVGLNRPVDLTLSAKFEETNSKMAVDMNLGATVRANNESADITLKSSQINASIPQQGLKATVNLTGGAVYDIVEQLADISSAHVNAVIDYNSGGTTFKGNINADTVANANLSSGVVDVPTLKFTSNFTTNLIKGNQTASADGVATYDINKQSINIKSLKFNGLGIVMDVQGAGTIAPVNLSGNVNIAEFNPQNVMKMLNIDYTPTDRTALTKLRGTSQFTFANNVLTAPMKLTLDDTAIDANVKVALGGAKLGVTADAALTSIDIDRYMPVGSTPSQAPAQTQTATAGNKLEFPEINLDLSDLPDLNVNLRAETVTFMKHAYRGVVAGANLKNGAADVKLNVNQLFSGKLTSTALVTARKDKFDATINLDAVSINVHNLLNTFAPDMDVSDMPRIASVDLNATIGNKIITASRLNIKADDYDIKSNLKADFTPKDKPMVTLRADVNDIYIKDFVGDDNGAAPASTTTANQRTTQTTQSKPINLNDIPVNADAVINIKSVSYDNIKVTNVNARGKLTNGTAELANLSGNTFGGSVAVSGKLRSSNGKLPADVQVTISNIKLEQVIQGFRAGDPLFSGDLDATANITTGGITVTEILSTITGRANYKLRNAVAHGIGYNPNLFSLDTLKNLNLFSNDKQTKIRDLDGQVTFENGRMNFETVNIDSDYLKGTMKGGIMLVDRTLSFDGTISVEGVVVPLTVRGPLNKPVFTIDYEKLIAGLVAQYAKKTATGIITSPVTVPSDILEGVGKGLDKLFNR